MKKNFVKVVGLFLAVLFALTGCGGGGSSNTTQTPQPVQKVSAVDGTWDDISGNQFGSNTFKLYGSVQFIDGNVYTLGYLGTGSTGTTKSKEGTFSLTGNKLSYTLTSSHTGGGFIAIDGIINNPGTTTAINESVTCTVTVSGDQLVVTDDAGNRIIFKKRGTDGMGLIPVIKDATITPSKIPDPFSVTTTYTPCEITVSILDSGADLDHVTVDFYKDGSGTKDPNNQSYTVPVTITSQSSLSKATVVIPYTITTLPMTQAVTWTHLIEVTAYDSAGNKSNTKQIYMWTI